MKPILIFLTAALLTVSGCVGGDASPQADPSSGGVAPGAPVEGAAVLRGVVVDDQAAPVAGAMVGLRELEVQTVSGDDGSFTISNLAPQSYTLLVQKLGYKAFAKAVTVGPDEEVEMVVTLEPLPIAEPYYLTNTKAALIQAAFGWSIAGDSGHGCIYPAVTCQSVATAANHNFTIKESEVAPLAGIVFEASWKPNSAVCAKTLRLRLFSPGVGTSPSATNPGHWTNDPHPRWQITSPVVMRIPRAPDGTTDAIDSPERIELNDGEPLSINGDWIGRTFPPGRGLTNTPVDFNCFTDQRVDLWFSHFYLEAPAGDFTARPDA